MRSGSGAVFVGALLGVALAVAREVSTDRVEAPPARLPPIGAGPQRAKTPGAPSSTPERALAPSSVPGVPSATAGTAPAASSAPSPSAGATLSSSSAPSAGAAPSASSFPLVESLPPLTTAKELERSELRCYERKLPDECERASVAYAAGLTGSADAQRAARLAKVAVTFVVRQCEDRSPHACLALAGRYKMGYGVPQSDRKAAQILAHARELCRERSRRDCVDGEPR